MCIISYSKGFEIGSLPPTLKCLSIDSDSCYYLPPLPPFFTFPPLLTHLIFMRNTTFNSSVDFLPKTLLVLKLPDIFNQKVNHLPPSLQLLHFGKYFNQTVDSLPSSLINLSFGFKFKKSVNSLPQSLAKLRFSRCSQALSLLPPALTYLTIDKGKFFNNNINNLPPDLIYFKFKGNSKDPLEILPTSLRHLHIIGSVDIKVDSFPSSLIYLTVPKICNLPLENSLHWVPSLIHLTFADSPTHDHLWWDNDSQTQVPECNWYPYLDDLPIFISEIEFSKQFNSPVDFLPPNVTKITFGNQFDQSVDYLPLSLKNLIFGENFNHPVDYLPPSLNHLHLGREFNQPIDDLPNSLKRLHFGKSTFNQNVDYLPSSLEFIKFSPFFNKSVDYLPVSLKYLTFGIDFNHSVDNLPENLSEIEFRTKFNLAIDHLPSQLLHLRVYSKEFQQSVDNLPSNLRSLTLRTRVNSIDHLPPSLISFGFGNNKSYWYTNTAPEVISNNWTNWTTSNYNDDADWYINENDAHLDNSNNNNDYGEVHESVNTDILGHKYGDYFDHKNDGESHEYIDNDHLGHEYNDNDHLGHENNDNDHLGHENNDNDHLGHEYIDNDHLGHENNDNDHLGHENNDNDHLGHENNDNDHLGHENNDNDHLGHEYIDNDHLGHEDIDNDNSEGYTKKFGYPAYNRLTGTYADGEFYNDSDFSDDFDIVIEYAEAPSYHSTYYDSDEDFDRETEDGFHQLDYLDNLPTSLTFLSTGLTNLCVNIDQIPKNITILHHNFKRKSYPKKWGCNCESCIKNGTFFI